MLAITGYALAGWWLKYTYNFSIGDAIARTGDAKFMIWSRDPHAAAIGVYWMPLPTVAQLPFMAILQPLGHPEYAGPLATAFWGGGTVLVLGRMCRDLGLPRLTGLLLTLAYVANPVVIYYAANGMSEGAEFFWIAVTLWGLLRFLRDYRSSSALITGLGLAGLALSKYEAIPIVGVVGVIVALIHLRRFRQDRYETLTNLALTLLPALWAILLWFLYLKIITGSFLSFRTVAQTTQGGVGSGTTTAAAAAVGGITQTLHFVGHWVLAFFPAALLLVPTLLLPPWRRLLGGIGVLAIGGMSIAATSYLVYKGGTYGNPRYFTAMVIIGAIAAIAVAGRVQLRSWRRIVIDPLLIAAVALAGVTGSLAEMNKTASVEHEDRVFALLTGGYNANSSSGDYTDPFRATSQKLDSLLKPGDRVLLDTRFTGPVDLYSTKPGQFIVNADRDYEEIVSPQGVDVRIEYAVIPPAQGITGLPGYRDDAYKLVHRQDGWHKVFETPVAQIWKRDPAQLRGLVPPPRG